MKSFLLRLDDGLHERVKAESVASRRSMQAVVLVALEEFLGGKPGPEVGREAKPASAPSGAKEFVGPFPKGGKR